MMRLRIGLPLGLVLELGLCLSCSCSKGAMAPADLISTSPAPAATCTTDTQCGSVQVCFAKTCQAQTVDVCRTDSICGSFGQCLSGFCQCTTWKDDCDQRIANNCVSGSEGNICKCGIKPACGVNSDTCTANEVCTCGTAAACNADSIAPTCTAGICGCGGTVCNITTSDSCVSGSCGCAAAIGGAVCQTGSLCTPKGCYCRTDGTNNNTQCASGQTCQDGYCKAQTVLSCKDNTVCVGLGICSLETESSNFCRCSNNSDCTVTHTTCSSDKQCVCGGTGKTKPDNADTCTAAGDWICGTRGAPCTTNSAAPYCYNGTCGCGTSSPCPGTQICSSNDSSGKCQLTLRRLFITSKTYKPPFSKNPIAADQLSAADAICQAEATIQEYGGTWAAVLGNKTISAYEYIRNHVSHSASIVTVDVPGKAVSGQILNTDSNTQPFGSALAACGKGDFSCINNWQNMEKIPFWVASRGESPYFTIYKTATVHTCRNWISSAPHDYGTVGMAQSSWGKSTLSSCNTPQALLCIELDP